MAINDIRRDRENKLQKIKELGVEIYPAKSARTTVLADAVKSGEGNSDRLMTVAGRIRSLRTFGKIAFINLEDESATLQLFFSEENLKSDKTVGMDFLSLLDVGDFVEATGYLDKTKTDQLALFVTGYRILSKSLLPLPSSWYGLKDVEERNRRKYLDWLMNPDSKKVIEKRSQIVYAIRKFLVEKKGYVEVENPILQPIYGGTRARPFKTHHNTLDMDLYLRISNELYLKRMIVGGFEKVFEIGHTFRNEGMDRNHNPEFTMLETMQAYFDYRDNMDLVEEMFEFVAQEVFGATELQYQGQNISFKRPWKRVRLVDLFKEHTKIDFETIDTLEEAIKVAKSLGVEVQDYMTDGEVLLEIFEKKCTTALVQPTFVYDYPADFYPLAKKKKEDTRFVESFDIYVAGMEMGTNYTEQNDPEEIRVAWLKEKEKIAAGNPEGQIMDEAFLEALEYGMPPTSGIGPGIDRWVMVMTDSATISDVIAFPMQRAEK
jgi:lysyl-tRNA synthetase class 2